MKVPRDSNNVFHWQEQRLPSPKASERENVLSPQGRWGPTEDRTENNIICSHRERSKGGDDYKRLKRFPWRTI